MKIKFIAFCTLIACIGMVSCDDTTENIGASLIDDIDKLSVKADTFGVSSETIMAGAVIARTSTGYLGRMEDPESQSTVTGNFMSQFHVLTNFELPEEDSIMSRDTDNKIVADSCDIRLFYNTYYGDSLSQMKLTAYELAKPVEEGKTYYSDFDPEKEGYIRMGGIAEKRSYTLADYTEDDSVRKSSSYAPNINIRLNKPYTDKSGKVYNNYGTYLIRKYQEDPAAFRDVYRFLHEICPGFYFKISGGFGSMAHIQAAKINVYFKYKTNGKVIASSTNFVGTEEVLQMTNIANDNSRLQELAQESGHTYMKTPAGLFTQLTLPMADIMAGHDNDSINSAKITLYRLNNEISSDHYFEIPQNVVMIPSDSLKSFFANNRLTDNKTSFLATYNSSKNAYVFNNIAGIVNLFIHNKTKSASDINWGKVVIVPVELQTVVTGSGNNTTTKITKISHKMGLASAKLQGNSAGALNINLSIIYSKFNGR